MKTPYHKVEEEVLEEKEDLDKIYSYIKLLPKRIIHFGEPNTTIFGLDIKFKTSTYVEIKYTSPKITLVDVKININKQFCDKIEDILNFLDNNNCRTLNPLTNEDILLFKLT